MVLRRCLLGVLLFALGCSENESEYPVPPYNSEAAKSALVAALDAWKKGASRELPKRTPAIRFVDDDLASGMRLADYEIEEPDAEIALHKDVAVILLLRDGQGRTTRREARYQVATNPGLAVLRADR